MQNSTNKILNFIQSSRQPLNYNQLITLYQQIIQFFNEQCNVVNPTSTAIMLLKQISNQRLFSALFSFVLATFNSTKSNIQEVRSLIDFIFTKIGKFNNKNLSLEEIEINISIMDILLCQKSLIYEKLLEDLKSSQTKSYFFFHWANNSLAYKMKKQKIMGMNLTGSTLHALKIIQSTVEISFSLIEQALRHLLIVDTIQNGQILSFILTNQSLFNSIKRLGQNNFVGGYWYYFVAKALQNKDFKCDMSLKKDINLLAVNTYQKMLLCIKFDADLTKQIVKINNSKKSQEQKLTLLYQIRGHVYFICSFIKYLKLEGKVDAYHIKIIQGLMAIQDFLCYQYLLNLYVDLIQSQVIKPHQININNLFIQQNCLPIRNENQQMDLYYSLKDIQFLSFEAQNQNIIIIPPTSNHQMGKILQMLLEHRQCNTSHSMCPCCSQFIHSAIEKQYDHSFNSHQFMSACHLMCRQIARLTRMRLNNQEEEELKNYLITNIKWLLNLNQSCLPQNRRCINLQIFQVISSYPQIFHKNQFLEIVVYDLLIARYPLTKPYLQSIVSFCKTNQGLSNLLLQAKLMEKLNDSQLKLMDRIGVWQLIIKMNEGKQTRLEELCQQEETIQFNVLSKFIIFKKRQLRTTERLQIKFNDEYKIIVKYPAFFKRQYELISAIMQK